MDFSKIEFLPYKYKLEKFTITIGDNKPFEVDTKRVISMRIEKDYDNYIFPYFEVDVDIPNSILRKIRRNNEDVRAFLDIQGGFSEASPDSVDDDTNIIWKSWVSSNFYVFTDDSTSNVNDTLDETIEKELDEVDKYGATDMGTAYLLLYNESYLFSLREIVNDVLQNASSLDAITFILNKSKTKHVLCSPPDNTTKYSQLIIPPRTAAENIEYFANNYALYKRGAIVFFDWDRGYILEKYHTCTAWETNETKQIYLSGYSNLSIGKSQETGCYKDKSGKCVINIQTSKLKFSTPSLTADQISGTNIVTINSTTGAITKTKSNTTTAKNGGSYQVYQINSGEDNSSLLKQTMSEGSINCALSFEQICLDWLKPNKEFIFSFDDNSLSEYAGKYRCYKYTASLTPSGNTMSCTGTIFFRGTNE